MKTLFCRKKLFSMLKYIKTNKKLTFFVWNSFIQKSLVFRKEMIFMGKYIFYVKIMIKKKIVILKKI